MATFSDVADNVVQLSVSSAGVGTHYTAPAGTRSKIVFQYLTTNASTNLVISGVTVFNLTAVTYPSTGAAQEESLYFSREIWLNDGETIATTGAGSSISIEAVIEEYANP